MIKSIGILIGVGAAFFIGWGAMNDILIRRLTPTPKPPVPASPVVSES